MRTYLPKDKESYYTPLCLSANSRHSTMCSFPFNSFACFQSESDTHARTKDRTRHLNLLRENLMKVLKKPSAMNIELLEPISLLIIHDLGGVETLSTCLQARFTDVGRPSIVYHKIISDMLSSPDMV